MINSHLQKNVALLSDMRQIVSHWSEDMTKKDPIPILARHLSKATMARIKDTYIHAFRPRFINGFPPEGWRLAKVLEDKKSELLRNPKLTGYNFQQIFPTPLC